MKAICLIRTSTIRQEVESQKEQIVDYAKSFGYTDIIVIGDAGASAIKLDNQYLLNLETVYSSIEKDKEIKAVFAWAIDRIGRNEEILMKFKNFLINHSVQLYIKEPTMYLLNQDGTTNAGMELAFSLFATMSKQEMEQKKARFKRAKERMKSEGKFAGGSIKNGYTTDKNGYIHLDPDSEGYSTIKDIFTEYATGNWSLSTLAKEINERGLKTNRGKMWTVGNLHQTLINKGYIEIVGQELYDKCQSVMANRWHSAPRNRTTNNLAVGILKCSECGGNYVRFDTKYRCLQHSQKNPNKPECHCKDCIDVEKLDKLLFNCAKVEEMIERLERNSKNIEQDKKRLEIINKKIIKLETDINSYNTKVLKIQEGYENGVYGKVQYLAKLSQLKKQVEGFNNEIIQLKKEEREISKRVKGVKPQTLVDVLNSDNSPQIVAEAYENLDLENNKYEIVHKHIKKVLIKRESRIRCIVEIIFNNDTATRTIIK